MTRALRLPYETFLALRYLRFHRGRTFLSVITLISALGVAVGTAALVVALALSSGFLEDVRRRIHSGSAHLTVLARGERQEFAGAERLAAQVGAFPGIAAASPVLYAPAMVLREDADEPRFAEIEGVVPGEHARVILEPGADDPFARLERPTASGRDAILLGDELAVRLDVLEGDLVRVIVARATLSPWGPVPRSQLYEVVGTYRSDHFQEDSQRAYVGLESARRLLQAPGLASWLEVRLVDLGRLERAKRDLGAALDDGWAVVDLLEQNRDLIRALNTEKLLLFLAIGLIVVVASLNIVSTLILMVQDKTKEIGTLSALGAEPRGIARIFVLQGLAIGTVGTAGGLAIGVALATWLDRYRIIRLDPEVYYLTHLPFDVRPFDVAVVAASALAISLAATVYPAWKAARLDPVEAIRYE